MRTFISISAHIAVFVVSKIAQISEKQATIQKGLTMLLF